MYGQQHASDDGGGHIGSASLPASRPVCIPVRFQPLGGAPLGTRWMGTGALSAAASTLPPPLPAHDNDQGPSLILSDAESPQRGVCLPATDTIALLPDAESASVCAATTAKPWLWPLLGAVLLVLVLAGGGAAWMVWQKRQRATSASALSQTQQETRVAQPSSTGTTIVTSTTSSSAPITTTSAIPLSPVQVPLAQSNASTAQPFFGPFAAPAAPGAATLFDPTVAPWPRSPSYSLPRVESLQQTAPRQNQSRGGYVMVERPPLRMRNVTATSRRTIDSDDDDVDAYPGANRNANGTSQYRPSQHRGHGRQVNDRQVNSNNDNSNNDDVGGDTDDNYDDDDDNSGYINGQHVGRHVTRRQQGPSVGTTVNSWTRPSVVPRQIVASPQESHYDQADMAHASGRRNADWAPSPIQGMSNTNNNTLPTDGRPLSDDDSLVGGVADYWAEAERARQTYFASPEERAAHAMRLGPRAYSPDGTPMPVRG